MRVDFCISNALVGMRLDRALVQKMPQWSRTRAADMISTGMVLVNGRVKRPGYKVKSGERIFGNIDKPPQFQLPLAEPMELAILFEDDHIILLNKPPGLVVHPCPGNYSHTLVNGLLAHAPCILQTGGDPSRPGIVHRLDKDTSGLILVAKTRSSLVFLQKEFKYRRVEKKYLALVTGKDLEEEGIIQLPIGRHPFNRKIMAVNEKAGKPAKTSWQVKQRFSDVCLVEVGLHTGRTHQIRVHFYAVDHPLLGDTVYQYKRFRRRKQVAGRQMLHSHSLSFRHPYSGRKMQFSASPPSDFIEAMKKL